MSEQTESAKRVQLSHVQFAHLFRCVDTHRDGVAQLKNWDEVAGFLAKKLAEQGKHFPLSHDAVRRACRESGVHPDCRRGGSSGSRRPFGDELDIVIRQVALLCQKLGEPLTVGMTRLLAIARDKTPANGVGGH